MEESDKAEASETESLANEEAIEPKEEVENHSPQISLPTQDVIPIPKDDVDIIDTLASIDQANMENAFNARVLETGEGTFVVEAYDDSGNRLNWIELDVGEIQYLSNHVELSWQMIDPHSGVFQLVIEWNTMDARNGSFEGYTMARGGILIVDVMEQKSFLNLITAHEYAYYIAGDDANLEEDDYHAKLAEDSEGESCRLMYDAILDGQHLTLSMLSSDGDSEECSVDEFPSGKYQFDPQKEVFVSINQ